MIFYILITSFIAISDLSLTVHSGPITKLPSKTTAVFYESPDQEGVKIAYRETAEDWSQLQRLFKASKVPAPTLLCIKGV